MLARLALLRADDAADLGGPGHPDTLLATCDDAGSGLALAAVVDDVHGGVVDGPPATVLAVSPGSRGVVTFDAVQGQALLATLDAADGVEGCGHVRLVGPDGRTVQTGCVRAGQGLLDTVVLPIAGRYAVVVDPPAARTGSVRVALLAPVDHEAAVTVGGAAARARVGGPGAISRVRFAGAAGQDVVVRVADATLADQCDVVRLVGPDGAELASACVMGDSGEVRATLTVTGDHVVVVDPRGRETGEVTVGVG
ncbi:hypothetical protein ICW40_18595 [Actinotalea ferrariae]|nr:hypothetical protein [Actinotalea ferrariae]